MSMAMLHTCAILFKCGHILFIFILYNNVECHANFQQYRETLIKHRAFNKAINAIFHTYTCISFKKHNFIISNCKYYTLYFIHKSVKHESSVIMALHVLNDEG